MIFLPTKLTRTRFVRSIGYRSVLAGNVKGFLDRQRNPDTQKGFADAHGMRPNMVTSFADGTILSLEATTLANATGFKVTKPGMESRRLPHAGTCPASTIPRNCRIRGWSTMCWARSLVRVPSS